MGTIDSDGDDKPVSEDADKSPHRGESMQASTTPRWFRVLIAAVSIGVAYWLYDALSAARIGILGAVAGVALYAGAVWMITKSLSGRGER